MKKLLLFTFLLFAINVSGQTPAFSIEGHRGARGLLPENTIPSFIKALEHGADTIELDLVISRDNKLVVSHEPWFSSVISLDKNGNPIPLTNKRNITFSRWIIPKSKNTMSAV
jgi:glycerophosphoryl diester phosphodiesterase